MIYLVKDILQFVLRQGRALHVLDRAELLGHPISILLTDWLHFLPGKLLTDTGVIAQIGLGADDETGDAGAVVVDFGEPFFPDVFERGGRGDGKADKKDVGLRIGEGAQAIVILLTGGVEKAEGVGFIADPKGGQTEEGKLSESHLHHSHGVVVENRGDILRGELVGCVRDEQAGLSDCTVPHHNTPGDSGLASLREGAARRSAGEGELEGEEVTGTRT